MVGTGRPRIVLFGSSIVQMSFNDGGWGAILDDLYARKADVVLRGYAGWNSRNALQLLDQIFRQEQIVGCSGKDHGVMAEWEETSQNSEENIRIGRRHKTYTILAQLAQNSDELPAEYS